MSLFISEIWEFDPREIYNLFLSLKGRLGEGMSDADICMLINVSVNGGEVHKQNMTLESVILTMPQKIISA